MVEYIKLEDLIDRLTEIKNRFIDGQKDVGIGNTSGITFAYTRDVNNTITIKMSSECVDDLINLYRK